VSVKILHTSDWHLDWKTVGVQRFDEVRAAVRQTVEAAKRERVDLYLCTGDVADPDGGTGVLRCVEVLVETAVELSNAGIESWWVAGNHDVVEDGTGLTTLSPLRGMYGRRLCPSRTAVFEEPRLASLGGVNFIFLPYPAATKSYDPAEFVRESKLAMSTLREGYEDMRGRKVVVATHLQIDGALLGEETTDMARGRDVRFPHEEMEPGWTVLAGHYHKRQVIRRKGCAPVLVVGALARLAFGEQSNTQSFQIVEV
jgi:DNA repair exonuclease SbcCD nuclease subunit